jgi:hypothetical protein
LSRARLLHHYALHRASADAQRLVDLQYARAAFVEAQDALFQLGPADAPALNYLFTMKDAKSDLGVPPEPEDARP